MLARVSGEPAVRMRPTVDVTERAEAVAAEAVAELADLLPNARVDHVGATSFPTGWTKGDVDLSVVVAAEDFGDAVALLGARFDVAQPENWTPTFASFAVRGRDLPLGLQVAVDGSPSDFLVALRDLLRSRPDLFEAYDAVKRDASTRGPAGYWEAKDRFLAEVLAEHLPASASVSERTSGR